jgi:hypothetical protein
VWNLRFRFDHPIPWLKQVNRQSAKVENVKTISMHFPWSSLGSVIAVPSAALPFDFFFVLIVLDYPPRPEKPGAGATRRVAPAPPD